MNRKGIVPILILLITAGLLIAGGVLYYSTHRLARSQPPRSNSPQSSSSAKEVATAPGPISNLATVPTSTEQVTTSQSETKTSSTDAISNSIVCPSVPPGSDFQISLGGPAEIQIINPFGKRLGNSPIATGHFQNVEHLDYDEIQCGSYTEEGIGFATRDTRSKSGEILNPTDGKYIIRITSIGDGGAIWIEAVSKDKNGKGHDDKLKTNIAPNTIITYSYDFYEPDKFAFHQLEETAISSTPTVSVKVNNAPGMLLISGWGRENLIVTDPEGYTVTPTSIIPSDEEYLVEIPGQFYYSEMEEGWEGRPINQVSAYTVKAGDYIIKVISDGTATTTSTFRLDFLDMTITSGTLIDQAPPGGYRVHVDLVPVSATSSTIHS